MSEHDGVKTYSVALWVPGLVALAGLAVLGLGVLVFRRWHKPLGVLLMVVGPVLAVAVPAMMFLNKVVVDDKHFEVVDCFLWNIERHDVAYDDVRLAYLQVEKKQTRSAGEVKKYTLTLTMKNGGSQNIVVKNALKTAWPELARQLRAHGQKDVPESLP